MLQIFIEHNGNGLTQEDFQQKLYSIPGLGLKNIQNRLNIVKGNIHFEKSDNLSIISVQIPITTQHPVL
jgi:two-component system, NarL family, sensor kinase